MKRFVVNPEDISGTAPAVRGSQVNHIRNVLRMRAGDHVILVDGSGYEYEAVLKGLSADRVDVEILKKRPANYESPIRLMVAQAFLKDKKMDFLVQHLTEMGMSEWFPLFTEHTVPRPEGKRLASRVERWKTIAAEAVKQCRRTIVPEIHAPVAFRDWIAGDIASDVIKIAFWEKETVPLKAVAPEKKASQQAVLVLIGPEGGFSDTEMELARSAGFVTASIGPRILKADTAAIAICALMQYLYGDMGGNSQNAEKNP
jgi:16S rRNA (uracil1498-N3)-methyltransferase